MRLRQIEVFHAIYTSGSMTNAARLLHVSQPSVSKVLAHAEQQLGYPLFDRVKGKLVPTPEAHRLFGHVSGVYQQVDELRSVARNLRSVASSTLRIVSTPAFGTDFLPQTISQFLKLHPESDFEIETAHLDGIRQGLLQSRFDVGLCFSSSSHPGIAVDRLATSECVLLAPEDKQFGKSRVGAIDLAGLPFIALNSHGPLGRRLQSYLENGRAEPKVVAVTETYHVARALAGAGAGLTIVDAITAAHPRRDGLRAWRLDPPLTIDIAALHFADAPLSHGATRFIDHLRQALGEYLSADS
ncbi:MAG: LysR family transcriptional regulator [Pseudomonadota bacterium]